MDTQPLGTSDLRITRVGIGSFAMGGEGWRASWGPQHDDDSIAAIRAGLDLGVNWIDTAPVYGHGRAETVVGKALVGMSEPPLIATKCGWHEQDGRFYGDLTAAGIRRDCEASLRRLRTDAIDLYQIHWPEPDDGIEEAWGEMAHLVREGKVRHLGVSNFSVEQMRRVLWIHPIASAQPPYSMLQRGVEEDILPFCLEHHIGVINYSPMYRGLLTGTFTVERAAALPETDHRRNVPLFRPPRLEAVLAFVEALRALASVAGRTPGELAIAWTLHHPAVTAAIVGLRSASQAAVLAAAAWHLDDAMYRAVDRALADLDARLDACRHSG